MLSHFLYRSVYFPRLSKKSRQKSKRAKMARRDDDYKFLQIADAIASINQRVNLIGVVTESGLPKQSKGTDFCVSIRIIDESRPSHGLSVNFFAETTDKLPHVMADGDIVQLSQVVMKTYGPDAVNVSYNKKFSSFALYEGKDGTSFTPYQCSNKFHAREQDNKFILALRKWLAGEHCDAGASATFIMRPADLLQLKDLKEGIHLNLVCKILLARETKRDGWMLFVWDGTDTPPVSIHTKLEDEMETSLPLQLESVPLSRNVLCTFPPCGTVLRVTVDSGNLKIGLNCIKAGQWVKLLSLRCEVRSSFWCAVLMPFTKLCNLSDDDDLVLQRKRNYDDRLSSKYGCMPLSCFPWHSGMTRTSCSSVPFTTLMNVLTYPEVTYRFRCVVRVAAALPWRVSDLRSPSGTYRIRLTLEDPTARIHAFLYADDAEEFFSLLPSADQLTRTWNLLLGVPSSDDSNNASRSPPWIECCLKSYYVDKSDVWGSRNYRIFATTLLKRP